jgi:type I restriction enzyme S subunit
MELGKLPEGWAWASIDELVGSQGLFRDGDWVESKDQDLNGSVRLIQLADIGDGEFRNKSARFLTTAKAAELGCSYLREGDLLIARMPDPLGRACLFPLKGEHMFVTVVDVCIVRLGHSQINNRYFLYALNSPASRKKISDFQTGSTRKRISRGNLSTIEFPIPPLAEQHRIVAKIEELFSELDQGVVSLKAAREQLKVYRQSLLKNAFEGKLTAAWRATHRDQLETAAALQQRIARQREARYQQQLAGWQAAGQPGPKPKAPKTLPPLTSEELAELPELPEGWEWMKLGEFIESIDAGKSFKCDEREPSPTEIGVAKVSAVTWGEYDESESKTCTDTNKENEAYFIRQGDFLLSRANTIDLVGACVIAKRITKKVMLSDKTLRIRFDGFSQDFFLQYLRCRTGRRQIMVLSTGNQESMRNIGQERIRSIAVPICSEAEARALLEELESKLSEADQLDQTLATALQQADALRQSILKKAFCGQLVKQDENDESASALLERIRAEKAGQVRGKIRRFAQKPPEVLELTPAPGQVIPFPVPLPGIAAKDLHAGILAMAYRLHEQHPERLQHFGHVKAEKISHLVEAHLGLDLERQPFKDAAGPNDHPHLKKVEHRARMANWFAVTRQDSGKYVFNPKSGFDRLLAKTHQALGGRLAEVERLLELMLPMTMRQAEILATVYAAWNNLLLLGKSPSEEEIVTEARENWHESKLKIERSKFFATVEWMRRKGLTPSGRGRFVAEKGKV